MVRSSPLSLFLLVLATDWKIRRLFFFLLSGPGNETRGRGTNGEKKKGLFFPFLFFPLEKGILLSPSFFGLLEEGGFFSLRSSFFN